MNLTGNKMEIIGTIIIILVIFGILMFPLFRYCYNNNNDNNNDYDNYN